MNDRRVDVATLGGVPAGASAVAFTARAGLETIGIDADKGITRRALLHNHYGFPDGITRATRWHLQPRHGLGRPPVAGPWWPST